MKRRSSIIAFGTYSFSGWDVYVLRITRTHIRTLAWHGCANPFEGISRHLCLRQIQASCLAETNELARKYEAHFGGVRKLVFSKVAEKLAKKHNVSIWGMREILDRAQATLGGIRQAIKWLLLPRQELKGLLPMELVRTQRGRWRLENLLLRIQFKQLIKKELAPRKSAANSKNNK